MLRRVGLLVITRRVPAFSRRPFAADDRPRKNTQRPYDSRPFNAEDGDENADLLGLSVLCFSLLSLFAMSFALCGDIGVA
jgi:hypothetical protein